MGVGSGGRDRERLSWFQVGAMLKRLLRETMNGPYSSRPAWVRQQKQEAQGFSGRAANEETHKAKPGSSHSFKGAGGLMLVAAQKDSEKGPEIETQPTP